MKGTVLAVLLGTVLACTSTRAEDGVPKTSEEGGRTVKSGGKEIGAGFRGVGRGIKKVFKGERTKEDFKKGAKIGEGFKDVGRGTAGVARGVGRDIKRGFEDDEPNDVPPPDPYGSDTRPDTDSDPLPDTAGSPIAPD